jgi:hypothetical protein
MYHLSKETKDRMSKSAKLRCTSTWRENTRNRLITPLDTGKVRQMYEGGMTQCEIAKELGVSQKVIWNHMKVNGIKARIPAKRNQFGELNSYWKGGKIKNRAGYVLLTQPEHPRADISGYVFEHIIVAEQMIGRSLKWFGTGNPKSEVVHHINGIKNDNRPENLVIMTYASHMELHNEMRRGDAKCQKIS